MSKSKLGLAVGALLVSGLLLAACGDDDETTSSTTSSTTTPTGVTGDEGVSDPTASSDFDTFVDQCQSAAQSGGAPADVAAEACGCVADSFEAQGISPEEADQLVAGAGGQTPKEFTTALQDCLGELPSG